MKGLKLYDEIFSDSELSKLTDFANELRTAGLNGELSGKPLPFFFNLILVTFQPTLRYFVVNAVLDKAIHVFCTKHYANVNYLFSCRSLILYSLSNTGETFILFNKQIKGNRRELIQFGIPIFGQIKEEAASKSLIQFIKFGIRILKITVAFHAVMINYQRNFNSTFCLYRQHWANSSSSP